MQSKTMTQVYLYFGAIASILFITGTSILALGVEAYNPELGMVGEIGRHGSAMEERYEILLLTAGISILIMSVGVDRLYVNANQDPILAIFVFAFALSVIGTGAFPTPIAVHNVFGLIGIIGYFSPLVYALTAPATHQIFRPLSWLAFALLLFFGFLNLSLLFAWELFPSEYHGLVQRSLYYIFYLWLFGLSFTLIKDESRQAHASAALGMA